MGWKPARHPACPSFWRFANSGRATARRIELNGDRVFAILQVAFAGRDLRHCFREQIMRAVLAAIWLVFLAGCPMPTPGGDEGDPHQNASALSPEISTAQPACPTPPQSFPVMAGATYAIVAEYAADAEARALPRFIGTGFAISPFMIATNAHVAEAIIAEGPLPLRRVVAVQSGTGQVVRLTHAIEHPAYNGSPLASADVAILLPREELDGYLLLSQSGDESVGDASQTSGPGSPRGEAADTSPAVSTGPDGVTPPGLDAALQLGAEIALTGFPGDVVRVIDIVPGVTVPQATALVGSITSRRSFDPNVVVTDATLDFIQHQAPTTPGMSGSPIVACGEVIAVNNAGTMKLVVSVDPETGEPTVDRQADAANNFGIHVRYLREIIPLVQDGRLPGAALP